MPVEPPAPGWLLPDVREVPPGQELVAVGADLAPGTLLAGYRHALFAMPDAGLLGWWSPDPRGILVPERVHVGRSLRRALLRFEATVDARFDEVVAACADPSRPHGWISDEYADTYRQLHRMGWAHSIEVWDATGELAGGLFGVEVGGLFAAESKFHRATDASKVAVVALADRLAAAGGRRIVDVQWSTPHLASLGVVAVTRRQYLGLLGRALQLPGALGAQDPPSAGPPPAAPPSRIRWRRA